ncbi:MAG: hypothetical protein A2Y10_18115 [Planctomycetes bacterium GWF2_41_51]|nr:MAG: hypothetical protein A2Y10_18115 [Planctomycetes bacterium GWF2_41_51]
MKTFTDNATRVWTISLTIDSVKRVRDLLNVNLLEPESGNPPLLTRIASDEILLCDIIFCLVKPQADALGVTDSQFGQALGGDVILAAQTAFYEELIDFFQKRGRTDRAKAALTQQKMINMAIEAVTNNLSQVDLDKELVKIMSGGQSIP